MFAKRLKELRSQKQVSQTELAKVLNISNRTISMYEQGYSEPNVETLIKISQYFNVSIDYLVGINNGKHLDTQKLYDEIGLSENSIQFLKVWNDFKKEYNGTPLESTNPLECIDFCLAQGELSRQLFDSILAYFLANVPDNEKLYINKKGEISLQPIPDSNIEVYQTISSDFLKEAILQEVAHLLKKFRQLYRENKFNNSSD